MLSFNSQSFQLFNVFRSLSLFLLFLCIYQSFLSTYKDIIGKLSIHHIMFFAYGSSKRKWKPFLLLLSLHQQKKEHRRRRKKRKKVSSSLLQFWYDFDYRIFSFFWYFFLFFQCLTERISKPFLLLLLLHQREKLFWENKYLLKTSIL